MQNDWEIHWEDYYEILGVNSDDDYEKIKIAYRNKSYIYHTDRMEGAPKSAKQEAQEILKKVNRAYDTLCNPEKRQAYDYEWKKRQRVESESESEPEPPVQPEASSEPISRRTPPVHTNPTVRIDTKKIDILSRILLVLGIGWLAAGLILYFTKTISVEVEYATLELQKAGPDTGLSWGNTNYYYKIQVKPISRTEPDIHYLITIDNGIVNKEYEVSWTQLELDIGKVKTISNKISFDEYTAYQMQSQFTVRFFELRPQHSVKYLIPGPSILIGCLLFYVRYRQSASRNRRHDERIANSTTRQAWTYGNKDPVDSGPVELSKHGKKAEAMLKSRVFWIVVSLGILFAVVHAKAHIGWSVAAMAILGITAWLSFPVFIAFYATFVVMSAKVSVPWGVGALAVGAMIAVGIWSHPSSSGSSDDVDDVDDVDDYEEEEEE